VRFLAPAFLNITLAVAVEPLFLAMVSSLSDVLFTDNHPKLGLLTDSIIYSIYSTI
jgi:hypothetical protein